MSVIDPPGSDQLPDQHVILEGISWSLYQSLRGLSENRGKRMIYDRGVLEIVTLSSFHERLAQMIARFIDEWTVFHDIPVIGCGSMTCQNALLGRGLEPDRCYYIAHAAQVRNEQQIDLRHTPPPDLVVEVDHRSGSRDKLPIYAALGVPEVWRWHRETLGLYRLVGERFIEASDSLALPGFPFDALQAALIQRHQVDETRLVRAFRQSLSSH